MPELEIMRMVYMGKFMKFFVFGIALLSLTAIAAAEGNESINLTTNTTQEEPAVTVEEPGVTPPPEEIPEIVDFKLINFTPTETKQGDAMLSIDVENTGNTPLSNLIPVIVARGFSTYDVVPINDLGPGELGTAFVSGNFNQAGGILLTIKINDKLFYKQIEVESLQALPDTEKIKAEEEAKQKALNDSKAKLEDLRQKYEMLENESSRKKNSYDLSQVNLENLKRYMMDAESSLISEDAKKAEISLALGFTEYADQKYRLSNAAKKPFLQKIKDNLVLISGIAAAIITLFSFYELMKNKHKTIYKKVTEIKIGKGKATKEETTEETKEVKIRKKKKN